MIEFGNTLRAAREAKGLTPNDIAARTHMMVQQIIDMENENFSKIAAPIYGRGFVRLYCEQVGLDPQPMIAEFMDIINGKREPVIRTRGAAPQRAPEPEPAAQPTPTPIVQPAPQPVVQPEPEPMPAVQPEPEPAVQAEPEPVVQPEPEPAPEPEPVAAQVSEAPAPVDPAFAAPSAVETEAAVEKAEPQSVVDDFRLEGDVIPAPPPSSFDEPKSEPVVEVQEPPHRPNIFKRPASANIMPPQPIQSDKRFDFAKYSGLWRIGALALGALLLLWLLYACVSSVWRWATTPPGPEPSSPKAVEQSGTGRAASAGKPDAAPARKPISLPALYID